ncbi:hypothetical protein C8Q76DRAFT_738129 [Earliella scabrosa]|nr:hypothetical protein C8Q76DRAFT_738129 [Earliella scabrosa]
MDDWEMQMCVEGRYCRPVAERDRMSARYRREGRILNRLARNDPTVPTHCQHRHARASETELVGAAWRASASSISLLSRIARGRGCPSIRTSGEDANAPQGLVCADALFEVLVIGESTASVCCCFVDPRRAIVRARYRQQGASTRRRAAPPSEPRAKTSIYVRDPAVVRWLGSVVLWQLCSLLLCPVHDPAWSYRTETMEVEDECVELPSTFECVETPYTVGSAVMDDQRCR